MAIFQYTITFKDGETRQYSENTCLPFFLPFHMARRLGYDAPFYLPPLEPPLEPESPEPMDELHERISVLEEGLQPHHKPKLEDSKSKEKPNPILSGGVKL